MNNVYVRMMIYTLAPMLAMVPGVTYDGVAQTLVLDLETVAMGVSAALVAIGVVFQRWGTKQ